MLAWTRALGCGSQNAMYAFDRGRPFGCSATMGNILKKLFGGREMRLLMLGLDSAGKTSKCIVQVVPASGLRVPFLPRQRQDVFLVYVFFWGSNLNE
jgi:hypothetical protein